MVRFIITITEAEETSWTIQRKRFNLDPSEDIKGVNRYRYLSSSNSEIRVFVSELLGAKHGTSCWRADFVSKVDARDFHNPGETVELAFDKPVPSSTKTEEVIR